MGALLCVPRCTDCVATEPDTCLRMELEKMTEEWMAAVADVAAAEAEKDELDDGVESEFFYQIYLARGNSLFDVVLIEKLQFFL